MFKNLVIILTIIIITCKCQSSAWDYEKFGPDVWSKTFSKCAGQSQSPVNIKTACTSWQTFESFHFPSSYNKTVNFTLYNNGHTIKAVSESLPILLSGGNLNGTYQLVEFHLHWGSNENVGSEHQVYVIICIDLFFFFIKFFNRKSIDNIRISLENRLYSTYSSESIHTNSITFLMYVSKILFI